MNNYSNTDITLAMFAAFAMIAPTRGSDVTAGQFAAAYLELTLFVLIAVWVCKFIENRKS